MGKEEKESVNEKGDLKSKEEAKASSKEGESLSTMDGDRDFPQTMPPLQRMRPVSSPGAHAISGPGGDVASLSTRTTNSSDAEHPPDLRATTTSETVLTATLVEERSPDHEDSAFLHVVQASPPPLARAEPVDDLPDLEAGHRTKSLQHDKSISTRPSPKIMKKRLICFTLVLSLVIISGLTAALVYVLRDSSEDPPPNDPPSKPRGPPGGFDEGDRPIQEAITTNYTNNNNNNDGNDGKGKYREGCAGNKGNDDKVNHDDNDSPCA